MTPTTLAHTPSPSTTLREPDLAAHLPALDGIRGLAILAVMLYHMTVLTSRTPFDRAYLALLEWGGYGVDLFFVLSGFLITGILHDSKPLPSSTLHPPSSPPRPSRYFLNFYARRTLRIFPLYYAVVFFSLVLLPHIPNPKAARFGSIAGDELWYWTYLSNYLIAIRQAWRHGILDVSWSLAIEEQFYLLWPAVVYLCSRRTLTRVCVALIFTALATRTAMVLLHAHPIATIVLTPSKFDALAAGALIAITVRHTGVLPWLPAARRTLPLGAAAFLLLYSLGGWRWDSAPMLTLGYTALATTFGSLLLLSLPTSPLPHFPASLLSHPLLRMFGRYSYALYLFHLPLRALVRDTLYGPSQFPTLWGSQLPGQLLFYPLAISLTLVAALTSWYLLEKPFLSLKRYFPAPHAATPTAPPNAGGGEQRVESRE
jgi:peptidoglycan/LPS O-acetylase OafA/YrhL